jgi:hypothetical protein
MSAGSQPQQQRDVGGDVGKALLNVPVGDMLASLGAGIASAQFALDMNSLRTAQLMSGSYSGPGAQGRSVLVQFGDEELSLLELGFTPSFYQFTETTIEIKISISMSTVDQTSGFSLDVHSDAELGGKLGFFSASLSAQLNVSTVGAAYSSAFNYSAEGASVIRTRLVPVPVPPILEERIRRRLDESRGERSNTGRSDG